MADTQRGRRHASDDRGASGEGGARTAGEILRSARLRRRISLTEAEQATRIRQRYLQALEDDDLSVLPAGVYSVGFLRNYAIFLGVPPDDVLAGVDHRRRRDRRPGVQSVAPPIQLSAPRTMWLFMAGGVVAVLLLALAWLGLSEPTTPAANQSSGTGATGVAGPARTPGTTTPAATPTSLINLPPLAPATTATVAPTPQPTTQAAPTTAATPAGRQVEVELRAVERAWVRATVDDQQAVE
ncbi:MAG TPA: helix-turn-helix transcriptional regulator, partial [Chloroflexota bacterium]|nr:helix-turn-helix transcriptional regulator [Chloroflexota bacterium]